MTTSESTFEVYVVTPNEEGEVNVYNSPALKNELLKLIEQGNTNLIVDLKQVDFIDSSGYGSLVAAWRRAEELGGSVRLVTSNQNLLKTLRITQLDHYFRVFPTIEAAQTQN